MNQPPDDPASRSYSVPRYMSAFLRLRMRTGILRLYGRHVAMKAIRGELREYLAHGLASLRASSPALTGMVDAPSRS